jgi:hypothetical protein
MTIRTNKIVTFAAIAVSTVFVAAAQQKMPETTKESIVNDTSVSTLKLEGTALHVEGNNMAVKMSTGEVREFDVPKGQRFIIDGKDVGLSAIKPGTKLQATVTTHTTSITDRTVTVGTGKVWWVVGNSVILTLPNGENRAYTVNNDYKFTVNGKTDATVFDLRKGMTVSAEKIVEEPRVEITTNTVVTGQAPPAPAAAPAPTPVTRTPAAAPKREIAQATPPPSAPRPAPTSTSSTPATVSAVPAAASSPSEKSAAKLPKTGSQLPLVGLLGLLFTVAGIGLSRVSVRVR